MNKSDYWRIFSPTWFKQHQAVLLFLLNTPILSFLFRWILRIRRTDCPLSVKITQIGPNQFSYGDRTLSDGRIERTTDFRTHDKFSKRIYYFFAPLWWTFHLWDYLVADRGNPELSFGFDTLTTYPDAHPETTSMDGYTYVYDGTNYTWAGIHDKATASVASDLDVELVAQVQCGNIADRYLVINRSMMLFNTSSLTGYATITAATLSLYGSRKADALSGTYDIYTSTPASNTAISTSDYQNYGSISQTGSAMAWGSYSLVGYNAFTFNATGISNISKTSISKFALRNANFDAANTPPSWNSNSVTYITSYSADQAATSNDPKLVVTYVTYPYNVLDLAGN